MDDNGDDSFQSLELDSHNAILWNYCQGGDGGSVHLCTPNENDSHCLVFLEESKATESSCLFM